MLLKGYQNPPGNEQKSGHENAKPYVLNACIGRQGGYAMDATFIDLLTNVKAIQDTPEDKLTPKDKEAIKGRINIEQTYEREMLMRENQEGIAVYEKFCRENADLIWKSQKNKYLALRSYEFIASHYWKNYKKNCAEKLEKDILQYLTETSIDEYPKSAPLPPPSPNDDKLIKLQKEYFTKQIYGHTKDGAVLYLSLKIIALRTGLEIMQERYCLSDPQQKIAAQAPDIIEDRINEIGDAWAAIWEKQGISEEAVVENLRKEINALEKNSKATQRASADLTRWTASYWPSLHGKASDAMSLMPKQAIQVDPYSEAGSITSKDVKLIIRELDKISGKMGVSTHKLLSMAIAVFTGLNNTGLGSQRDLKTGRAFIPLKAYAAKCGYDVYEHPTTSAAEEEQEAKRAKNALDNARKKIKKDLQFLLAARLSWEEKIRGKSRNFDEINILGRGSIRNGQILVEFSSSMAEYLLQLPLTQYPASLLKVDERNNNAYSMGLAMAEHYSMDGNHIMGTANLLKVGTLLQYTSLPGIDDIRAQRKSWEERLKEPFEKALDELTRCGLLADWRYSKSKGEELTFDEATNFTEYEDWAGTLIYFELKDAPDHTVRIAARQKELAARRKKSGRKTVKKSN